jgi:hypothetical protein
MMAISVYFPAVTGREEGKGEDSHTEQCNQTSDKLMIGELATVDAHSRQIN